MTVEHNHWCRDSIHRVCITTYAFKNNIDPGGKLESVAIKRSLSQVPLFERTMLSGQLRGVSHEWYS